MLHELTNPSSHLPTCLRCMPASLLVSLPASQPACPHSCLLDYEHRQIDIDNHRVVYGQIDRYREKEILCNKCYLVKFRFILL